MNINGDVHFDGMPTAKVKYFTGNVDPGFCVLQFVDIDEEQHQFFLKPKYLASAHLVAAAFNGDLPELRRLIAIADAADKRAACLRQMAEQI